MALTFRKIKLSDFIALHHIRSNVIELRYNIGFILVSISIQLLYCKSTGCLLSVSITKIYNWFIRKIFNSLNYFCSVLEQCEVTVDQEKEFNISSIIQPYNSTGYLGYLYFFLSYYLSCFLSVQSIIQTYNFTGYLISYFPVCLQAYFQYYAIIFWS